MIWIYPGGVIYNQKKFAEAGHTGPKRYLDLADPRLKARCRSPTSAPVAAIPAIVGMSYEGGGSEATSGRGRSRQEDRAANFWSSSSNRRRCSQRRRLGGAAQAAMSTPAGKVDLAIVFPPVAQGKGGVLKQGYLVKIKGARTQGAGVDHQPVLVAAHAGRGIDRGRQVPVHKARSPSCRPIRILLPASVAEGTSLRCTASISAR